MCGRFTLTMDQEALQVALGVEGLVHPRPRYNVAPTQEVPAVAVVRGEDGGQAGGWSRRAFVLKWGLVPSWASDPSIGHRLINARSETAHAKPAFRAAFREGRCLIPADGFYEWKAASTGKTPFWAHLDGGGVFTFAGLRERWEGDVGGERKVLDTFTILTTAANELLKPIHDRMPVIIAPDDRALWLDPDSDRDRLRRLLRPYPPHTMAVREVSRRVNAPKNDDPGVLDPPSNPPGDLPLFPDAD